MRKFPDHILTISKTRNKAKTMSCVDAFTPEMTAAYARKMIERESRGSGDQLNALEKVGRACGMTPRSLRRLINGETKDPGLTVFGRVRAAYLELCDRQIKQLQHEVETDKVRFGDATAFADLDHEIEALAAKLRKAKGTLT